MYSSAQPAWGVRGTRGYYRRIDCACRPAGKRARVRCIHIVLTGKRRRGIPATRTGGIADTAAAAADMDMAMGMSADKLARGQEGGAPAGRARRPDPDDRAGALCEDQ